MDLSSSGLASSKLSINYETTWLKHFESGTDTVLQSSLPGCAIYCTALFIDTTISRVELTPQGIRPWALDIITPYCRYHSEHKCYRLQQGAEMQQGSWSWRSSWSCRGPKRHIVCHLLTAGLGRVPAPQVTAQCTNKRCCDVTWVYTSVR